MNSDIAWQEWRRNTLTHTEAVNTFVARGLTHGWDRAGDNPDPKYMERNEILLPDLLEALRAANAGGKRRDIREKWPVFHEALHPLLKANGQSIPALCALPDGSLIARIGAQYQEGKVVRITGDRIEELSGICHFGRCPNRRYFAVSGRGGVTVTDGWQGNPVCFCPWPTGRENVPDEIAIDPVEWRAVTQLIPFPCGTKVLLVSRFGVFVLFPHMAHRLLPTPEQIGEYIQWHREEAYYAPRRISIDMEHGAVSRDGRTILAGQRIGHHYAFDASLQKIAAIGPQGEYPHFTMFSHDGETAVLNACRFFHGATVAVATSDLNGFYSDFHEEDERLKVIDPNARVYAGISRGDDFIFGDAYGYLRCVGRDGSFHWHHFVGSTISALDLADDGRTLLAATCAGVIAIIELDAGRRQPDQIGTADHFEHRRWLFWREEKQPLAW